MRRASPDSSVARELRQEVDFCCPVCGGLILTYHHFDPPWQEQEHNNPKGMIALCPTCHTKADAGVWTRAQLRDFKRHPRRPRAEQITALEAHQRVLYRIGGNYADVAPGQVVLTLGGKDVIRETRSRTGRPLFSLYLLDESDQPLLRIHENSLSFEDLRLWDVQFRPQARSLTVRRTRGEVFLDIKIRRLAPSELKRILQHDGETGRVEALAPLRQIIQEWKAAPFDFRDTPLV
jgi:hypothetical protein